MSKESAYVKRIDQAAEEAYKATASTSLRAATDECKREMHVRLRVYPGWMSAGKLSYTDAEDRGNRLETAVVILEWLQNQLDDMALKKLTPEQFAVNAELLAGGGQ